MTTAPGLDINFMVVKRSAVIKFDKHVASRVFPPDELESLDSYMMKYRKYGIVELFDNKLDHVDYDHECAFALPNDNWTLPGKRVQPDCERCHMEHPEMFEDSLFRLRAVHRDCNYLGQCTGTARRELRQLAYHHIASTNPLNLLCKSRVVKSYL